jgi:hypothetical protein
MTDTGICPKCGSPTMFVPHPPVDSEEKCTKCAWSDWE